MIIYEVNLTIQNEIADSFGIWLQEHIADLLKIDGFESAHWFERKAEENEDEKTQTLWTVQYHLQNHSVLQNYFDHHAPQMRQDGIDRFGKKFYATRRVLELKERFLA